MKRYLIGKYDVLIYIIIICCRQTAVAKQWFYNNNNGEWYIIIYIRSTPSHAAHFTYYTPGQTDNSKHKILAKALLFFARIDKKYIYIYICYLLTRALSFIYCNSLYTRLLYICKIFFLFS